MTPARRAFVFALGILAVALLWHAVFVEVIPAPWFSSWPVIILSFVAGVAVTFWAWRRNRRLGRTFGNVLTRPLTYLALPFIFGGCVWLILANSTTWFSAALFGAPHAEAHEFVVDISTRKGCNHRAKPVGDLALLSSGLCLNPDYALRHRDDLLRLRLVGDRTPMGFRILRIEHDAVVGPAPPRKHSR
jgi:hypothetical protein